uniref:RING-type domain-containing protein n=1 Tax=Zooxanthella nutricula TaxID=1333877 RepID=A0A7S2P053_9DINO|mmetsp:Transcript_4380/g.13143  ORF Transcript_4380/g.13143 Transcript_4380/m.13143 type:complete len:235 (+) Transcript_4380:63-767(+)
MPAVDPPAVAANLWKQGLSTTGLTAGLRWRWRHVELLGGCLVWSAWKRSGGRAHSNVDLVPRGMLDLRLTSCDITKLDGATQFKLSPARGHDWKSLPYRQSFRTFVFDAKDSGLSRDEWCRALHKHAHFGRRVAEEMALSPLPPLATQLIPSEGMQAYGICSQQEVEGSCVDECPICFEDLDNLSVVARTPCGHVFHEDCVRRWLAKRGTCPLCREQLCDTERAERQPRRARPQ